MDLEYIEQLKTDIQTNLELLASDCISKDERSDLNKELSKMQIELAQLTAAKGARI